MNQNNKENYILYYSNHCNHSKNILQFISNSKIKESIHFINLDYRFRQNGQLLVRMPNNKIVAVHPDVKHVPTLLHLGINNEANIYEGSNILSLLKTIENELNMNATNNNGEPCAFSLNSGRTMVVSDNYSFLDQSSEELSAKGNGGLRQMHNYVDINQTNATYAATPKDNYQPDKIGNISIDNLRKMRENDIPKQHKRM